MPESDSSDDLAARRLILAVQNDLRRWLGVPQLDHELIGALYVRLRDILGRCPKPEDSGTIDEVALTIYATAAAWQSQKPLPLELLAELRDAVAPTMHLRTVNRRQQQTTRSD